jgi:glycosyltransferase involved in cell wall biosynthesis
MSLRTKPRALVVHARATAGTVGGVLAVEAIRASTRRGLADVAVFHDLLPPPTGGGSQFLRALIGQLRRAGLTVELNRISGRTPACLVNSYTFDERRLRRFLRDDVRLVHRVDGPIGVYRGSDDRVDRRIAALNAELAHATVLQSHYSLEKHRALGLELVAPIVIPNAPDGAIFHPPVVREPVEARRIRVVASSWSDNPRKGADALRWLDEHVDCSRFEVTFVGRAPLRPSRVRVVPPLASEPLADLLRTQDLYLAASLDDPCSNALLEALACGLPAVFRRSGGHPELVGEAGVGFDEPQELADALDDAAARLQELREAIAVPALADVAARYAEVLAA